MPDKETEVRQNILLKFAAVGTDIIDKLGGLFNQITKESKKINESNLQTVRLADEINERLRGQSKNIGAIRDIYRMIANFKDKELNQGKQVNVTISEMEKLQGRIFARTKIDYQTQENIMTLLKSKKIVFEDEAKLGDKITLKWRSLNEMLDRARRGSKTIVTNEGELVQKQTMSDKLLTNTLGTLQELGRSFLPIGIFAGGLVMALVQIVDSMIKASSEGQRFKVLMGDIKGASEGSLSALGSLSTMLGDIMMDLRINKEEAKGIVEEFITSGGAMRALGDDVVDVTKRAILFKEVASGSNIELRKSAELSQMLRFSFNAVQKETIRTNENLETSVSTADEFTLSLMRTANEFSTMGLRSDDIFGTMTSIVDTADKLNLDYRQSLQVYNALLNIKKEDLGTSRGLSDLSYDALKNMSEISVKASDWTLQTKAMVAAFAGMPFTSLLGLEETFRQPGEVFKILEKATKRPVELMLTTMRTPEERTQFEKLVKSSTEQGTSARRLLYDIFRGIYDQIGVSFEMFDVLSKGGTDAKLLQQRMESVNISMEKNRGEVLAGVYETATVGASIIRMSGGISQFTNWLAGAINKMVGYLATIANSWLIGGGGGKGAVPAIYREMPIKERLPLMEQMARVTPTESVKEIFMKLSEWEKKVAEAEIAGFREEEALRVTMPRLRKVIEAAQKAGYQITIDVDASPEQAAKQIVAALKTQTEQKRKEIATRRESYQASIMPSAVPLIELPGSLIPR